MLRSLAGTAGLIIALLLSPGAAYAAGFDVIVDSPGARSVMIAIPKPLGPDDKAGAVWEVVRRDLDMSGYFSIIDADAYIEKGKGIEPGTFDFGDWTVLHAAALAKTRVTPQSDGLKAEVYVYDVAGGTKIEAKAFLGKSSDVRYLGHKIADTILRSLTGQSGFFGARLAVVGNRSGHKEIYLMDIDGEGITPVTNNGSINLSPAWSPDGNQIAYTSYKRDNPDLYVKDLAKGATRILSARRGINIGAAYSRDGTKVALTRSENGDSDIFVVDALSGAELQRLTRGNGIDVSPTWSPDGKRIAFASERSGGVQIYVQDVGGGEPRRVTFDGSMNVDPVFSPDGSKLAFVSRAGKFDIWTVDLDGHGLTRITQNQGDNEDPCWSPDGRYLLFSSTRSGRSEVWLSTADGRSQVAVTPRNGGWTQPVWAPR
jgi:TolB protein